MNPYHESDPSTSSGSTGRHRIGILMADRANSFWTDLERHLERQAPESALDLKCFWPSPGRDPQAQLDMMMDMLALNLHAIVINPLDRENLVPAILRAAEREIPVFDVGGKTDPARVEAAGGLYIQIKTVDFYEQGKIGGRAIIDRIAPQGGKVAILEGRRNAAQSIGRSKGAADAFAEKASIHLCCCIPADFDRETARNVAAAILTAHADVSGFFCVNDGMALGVSDAIEGTHLGRRPIIVGVDLIDEARQAIREGRIYASVAFSREAVARRVLSAVRRRLDGMGSDEGFGVSSLPVTRENLDRFEQ